MRYFVTDYNGIPYKEQPKNGYTKLQVIERVQKEIENCIKLFGGNFQDYKDWFIIKNNKFETIDLKDAI